MLKTTRKPGSVYFILLPLTLLAVIMATNLPQSCETLPQLPKLSPQELKTYRDFIASSSKDPLSFLAEAVAAYQLVFLGEYSDYQTSGFAQNVSQLTEAVGLLYEKGLRVIALEGLYAEDQPKIDGFMQAAEFSESSLKEILGTPYGILGYAEYSRLIRQIWEFNHNLRPGQKPYRLVGLGQKLDLTDISSPADAQDYAKLKKACGGLTAEEYIKGVIEKEIIPLNVKALLYLRFEYCLKDIVYREWALFYEKMGLDYEGSPAKILASKLPGQVYVIFQHNLWVQDDNRSYCYPLEGRLDAVLENLAPHEQRFGFAIKGSPFASLILNRVFASKDGKEVTPERICDGYLVNGPLYKYRLTPLEPGTISSENFASLKKAFALSSEIEKTITYDELVNKMNTKIAEINKNMASLRR